MNTETAMQQNSNELSGRVRTIVVVLCVVLPIIMAAVLNYLRK